MPEYYLNIPTAPYSSAAYIELPVYLGVNWGTSAYAIEFSIRCDLTDAGGSITVGAGDNDFGNSTLISCIVGGGNGSTGYIQVRGASSTTGQVVVATSSTGIPLKDGQFHTYRFEHDADGTCRFKLDGTVYGATSSYTTSVNGTTAGYGVKRFFRTLNGVVQGDIRCRYIKYEGFTNSDTWDANLSNGTATVFPSLSGTRNGTQVGSAWPSDNSEWVSLVTATPVAVSVGKTTYSLLTKAMSVSVGGVFATNKIASTTLQKALNIATGSTSLINRTSYGLSSKQLSLGLSCIAVITKTTQNVIGKQLLNSSGSSLSLVKESVSVEVQPLDMAPATALIDVLKSTIVVSNKNLTITVDTKIPAMIDLNVGNIEKVTKHLSVALGNALPLAKANVSLSAKSLTVTLSYPLIPTDQVYRLSNVNNFFNLSDTKRVFNLTDK